MGVFISTYCNDQCNRTVVWVIGSSAGSKCTNHTGNNGKKISAVSTFVGRPIGKLLIRFGRSDRENNWLDSHCAPSILLPHINNYLLSTLSEQDIPCLRITAINGLPSKLPMSRLNFNQAAQIQVVG
jgi:hypothetical protein